MRILSIFYLFISLFFVATTKGQTALPTMADIVKRWGPNDTIIVSAVVYDNDIIPAGENETVWVSNMNEKKLQKYIAEWTRLRNAVYVTYPYARVAGATINDINVKLTGVTNKKERKKIIQSREKELRKQFADPLSNLSVYQGRVLMKLINRQTGNNCYEIIKDFKGSFNARFYQTVAFFVGGNLKQKWDLTDKTDSLIESIVQEIDGQWSTTRYQLSAAPSRLPAQ